MTSSYVGDETRIRPVQRAQSLTVTETSDLTVAMTTKDHLSAFLSKYKQITKLAEVGSGGKRVRQKTLVNFFKVYFLFLSLVHRPGL